MKSGKLEVGLAEERKREMGLEVQVMYPTREEAKVKKRGSSSKLAGS